MNQATKALQLDHDIDNTLRSEGDCVETSDAIDAPVVCNDVDKVTSDSVDIESEPTESDSGDDSKKDGITDNDNEIGDISYSGKELNPWSLPYVGIQINYFSVGLIYAGSVSILYPILVIQQGATAAFYTAAVNLVTVFWSYKIFFGVLSDCFPVLGYKKKSYIVLGWLLCAMMLVILASLGKDVSASSLVFMLTFANLGYVMADVAADGFVVWMAHRESVKNRGSVQALIYTIRELGRICINIVIIFGFSGPAVNCPGYEKDPNVPCTTDESIASRNDMFEEYPDSWCHMKCTAAAYNFGLTIPQYVWIIAAVNLASIPSYLILHDDKVTREKFLGIMASFWKVMQKRAVWQVMLYSMISNITFNVYIAAKPTANFVWLNLSTLQNQILNIVESLIFFVGLSMIRKFGLNFSWRKLIWMGSLLVTFFNLLYLLIVYNVLRNAWFYIFTDVSATFMYSLNFMASAFAIVEVSEPGFEAITYALVTTASNAVLPLASVISYQFMGIFPDLNTQEGLAKDTPSVRNQMAFLVLLVEIINLTSLVSLPMLPRQKKEAQELMKKGETSSAWAKFTLISGLIFLIYSTLVTFFTVAGANSYDCYKILGGPGCTDSESSVPVYMLIGAVFLYCYGVNFMLTFWPMIKGREQFSWSVFV